MNLIYFTSLMIVLNACGGPSSNKSTETGRIGEVSNKSLVAESLSKRFAIRVNLTTNRLSYLNDGVVVDQWNIATGDVTGKNHSGTPKYTPPGVYAVDEFVHCPQWMPRSPIDPKTGKEVTNEESRFKVFSENPKVYGACGASNPLGEYVMWFSGPYGLHGNANEKILQLKNSESRRVSGGCIRNPNAKVKWMFHDILTKSNAYKEYSQKVLAMETSSKKRTVSGSVNGLGVRVVVDYFDRDPAVGENVSRAAKTLSPAANRATENTPFNKAKDKLSVSTAVKKIYPTEKVLPSDGQGDIKVCTARVAGKVVLDPLVAKFDTVRLVSKGDEEKVYGKVGDYYRLVDGYMLSGLYESQCKPK